MSGLDGMDGIGLSYTTVTPRASLQSDANNFVDWVDHISSGILSFCCISSEIITKHRKCAIPYLEP